ncbi:hypothetical protein ACIRRA_28730 [Nocardia sp. NPDC101769]|uniref:hypothetical protein n=1 Tax=Nocardia sp. NPDC101769 TaxID=3364333 RepID=UPI0038132254
MTAFPTRRATGEFAYAAVTSSPKREEGRTVSRRRAMTADEWSEPFAGSAAARDGGPS